MTGVQTCALPILDEFPPECDALSDAAESRSDGANSSNRFAGATAAMCFGSNLAVPNNDDKLDGAAAAQPASLGSRMSASADEIANRCLNAAVVIAALGKAKGNLTFSRTRLACSTQTMVSVWPQMMLLSLELLNPACNCHWLVSAFC